MVKSALLITFGMLIIATGCDRERVARLEKENLELKAEVSETRTALDYDLQSKCSKDAKGWFHEAWAADKNTILLKSSNHYNKKLNACFAVVEYHFYLPADKSTWVNEIALWNVYEDSDYGSFREHHRRQAVNSQSPHNIFACRVLDKKCSSLKSFVELVRPYMND